MVQQTYPTPPDLGIGKLPGSRQVYRTELKPAALGLHRRYALRRMVVSFGRAPVVASPGAWDEEPLRESKPMPAAIVAGNAIDLLFSVAVGIVVGLVFGMAVLAYVGICGVRFVFGK